MAEFKDRLKLLRKEKKLTQVKLGEMLNYGYTAIANYESGRNQPSITDLIKIATIFDVSLDYLLGVTDVRHVCLSSEISDELQQLQFNYTQLDQESRTDLLMYAKWLLDRNDMKKDFSHSLQVAQDTKQYTK